MSGKYCGDTKKGSGRASWQKGHTQLRLEGQSYKSQRKNIIDKRDRVYKGRGWLLRSNTARITEAMLRRMCPARHYSGGRGRGPLVWGQLNMGYLVSSRSVLAVVRPCCVGDGGRGGAAAVAVAGDAIAQCLSARLVRMYKVRDTIFSIF